MFVFIYFFGFLFYFDDEFYADFESVVLLLFLFLFGPRMTSGLIGSGLH
jgi:hypothetical protein